MPKRLTEVAHATRSRTWWPKERVESSATGRREEVRAGRGRRSDGAATTGGDDGVDRVVDGDAADGVRDGVGRARAGRDVADAHAGGRREQLDGGERRASGVLDAVGEDEAGAGGRQLGRRTVERRWRPQRPGDVARRVLDVAGGVDGVVRDARRAGGPGDAPELRGRRIAQRGALAHRSDGRGMRRGRRGAHHGTASEGPRFRRRCPVSVLGQLEPCRHRCPYRAGVLARVGARIDWRRRCPYRLRRRR